MTDSYDPHGILLKEYYDPERDMLMVVVKTFSDPRARVVTAPRTGEDGGDDEVPEFMDRRHANTIQPYILLHETMILVCVHLMNDAIQGTFINPNDGKPWSDFTELRERVREYERMMGYFFLYNYADDQVTLIKITDENQHWADVTPLDRFGLRLQQEQIS